MTSAEPAPAGAGAGVGPAAVVGAVAAGVAVAGVCFAAAVFFFFFFFFFFWAAVVESSPWTRRAMHKRVPGSEFGKGKGRSPSERLARAIATTTPTMQDRMLFMRTRILSDSPAQVSKKTAGAGGVSGR